MNPAIRMMIDRLNDCASRGLTYREAADEIGGSIAYVYSFACRHGIKLPRKKRLPKGIRPVGHPKEVPTLRSHEMAALFRQGTDMQIIGNQYGITRERVRQILKRDHELTGKDGGGRLIAALGRVSRINKIDAKFRQQCGCSFAQYKEILRAGGTSCFSRFRQNLRRQNVGLDLSLWQWWTLWQDSGHWDERGRGHRYWMFRLRTDAPLSVENYCIAPGNEARQLMRQAEPLRKFGGRRSQVELARGKRKPSEASPADNAVAS